MKQIIPTIIVEFYRFWHGTLHLKGAGYLLSHFSKSMKGLHDYPLKLPGGEIVRVDFRELSGIGWLNTILGDQGQEDPLIHAISRHINSESILWDIGSNAGILSYLIIGKCPYRELHYFEPNPKLYAWASSVLSRKSNTRGYQVALSNDMGEAILHVPRNQSAYGSLKGGSEHESDLVSVKKTTGDDLIVSQQVTPPSIIKIDTEGHEVEVIEGMKNIIEKYRPIIFFEHIELSDADVSRLIPDNYQLKTVSNGDGSLTAKFDRGAGHNSVLMPS
jgi:FkbM family methyltransferase